MAHRRAHHLERCHPRRAAAAVRRPEARRARDRRRADPEPRHARRQHLHGLAGGRRRAQPAGARRQRRAGKPGGPTRGADARLHRRLSPHRMPPRRNRHRHPRAQAEQRDARPFPEARRAQVSGDLDRDGRRRDRDATTGPHCGERVSPSAPARRSPSGCRLGSRVDRAAVADGCGAGGGIAFRWSGADRRHSRLGGLPARGGAGADARSAAGAGGLASGGGPRDAGAGAAARDRHRRVHAERAAGHGRRGARSHRWRTRCATSWGSPAPRSAARRATAAPAPCSSTASRCAPAWWRRRRPTARRSRPSKASARAD